MVCCYKSKPKQKGFMCHIEMLWGGGEKHPTATRNMKRINNHQYAIMKKQLLSDLCVPHSPCVEGPLNHPKSVTDVQSCLKCKLIVTFLVLPDLNTKQILSVLWSHYVWCYNIFGSKLFVSNVCLQTIVCLQLLPKNYFKTETITNTKIIEIYVLTAPQSEKFYRLRCGSCN